MGVLWPKINKDRLPSRVFTIQFKDAEGRGKSKPCLYGEIFLDAYIEEVMSYPKTGATILIPKRSEEGKLAKVVIKRLSRYHVEKRKNVIADPERPDENRIYEDALVELAAIRLVSHHRHCLRSMSNVVGLLDDGEDCLLMDDKWIYVVMVRV